MSFNYQSAHKIHLGGWGENMHLYLTDPIIGDSYENQSALFPKQMVAKLESTEKSLVPDSMVTQVQTILQQRLLYAVFQPIVDLNQVCVYGHEGLI
ncbi:MAG TPA: hypothetical protein VGC12_02145, partial [Methyloradius sp.]